MATNDILYDKIKPSNGVKTVKEKINDQLDVTYTVTTKDGIETWVVTTIIVTSGGPPPNITVIVDEKTIAQPPPIYQDCDYCFKNDWSAVNAGCISG